MGVFGRGGDMFSSFMMPPMHQAPPPPPPFHGFNRQFMTGGFGGGGNPFFSNDFMSPMMGPFQQQQQQSSSSYIGTSNMNRGGGGGGYSKSVSTSTRNINGVVESVKITKITDENVSFRHPTACKWYLNTALTGNKSNRRIWKWNHKDKWRRTTSTTSN